MPKAVVFTEADQAKILRLRGEGLSYDVIATRMHVSRERIFKELRAMGFARNQKTRSGEAKTVPPRHHLGAGALPAGHENAVPLCTILGRNT
jgi:hypothetical protein